MSSSFTDKRLRATLIMAGANSVFPGTNSNTLMIDGLRMETEVEAVARLSTQAHLRIFGMKQTDMNALTVAWANPPVVLNNLLIIEANGSGKATGWTQVFKGTIIEAQPDYTSAPDVAFAVTATTGYFVKINPAPPTSYPETIDIGVAASDIIEAMGAPWTYVDGGATGVITNPYFWGTLWDQLGQACAAANADYYIQGDQILVTPNGQPRNKQPAVTINAESGLVGYPMFERSGLNVLALWDAAFLCGTAVDVESDVPNATGRWFPYALRHRLSSLLPGGPWFSELKCLRVLV